MNKAPNDRPQPRMGPIHTEKLSHIESSLPVGFSEPQRHKRILVVDDNSDIVFTLRLELERDPNIQVYGYDNPVTTLLEFKENFYDLLLIDVNMPLMDGFQLAQKLLQKDLNVKICFITAGEMNVDAAREVHPLKTIGCFIKKPIAMEHLINRIRAELE